MLVRLSRGLGVRTAHPHPHPRRRRPERHRPRALRGARRTADRGAGRHPPVRRGRAVLRSLLRLRLLVQRRGELRQVGAGGRPRRRRARPAIVPSRRRDHPARSKGRGAARPTMPWAGSHAMPSAPPPIRRGSRGWALPPWQARKIYQGGIGGGGAGGAAAPTVTVRTGTYDPLLGQTWRQLGSVARAQHRSQGVAQLVAPPVEGEASFLLLDSAPAAARARSGRARRPRPHLLRPPALRTRPRRGGAVPPRRPARAAGAAGRRARGLRSRRPREDAAVAAGGAGGRRGRWRRRCAPAAWTRHRATRLVDRLGDEARDVEAVLRLAHGLDVEALADDDVVVPGQSFTVTTRISNLGAVTVSLDEVTLRATEGWSVRTLEGSPRASWPAARAWSSATR